MDFKEATDILFSRIDHVDLAETLGISVASIRQARLSGHAKGNRSAPSRWQEAVTRLAAQRIETYESLIKNIEESEMPAIPHRISEPNIGVTVLKILASFPYGEATVSTIKKLFPDYITLSDDDKETSDTRPNEEIWEQQIRNLRSHNKTPGNIFAEGLVISVGRGRWRITDAGRSHLSHLT